MQFRVLGPVELAVEGRRVPLTSDRQRAVLAALLTDPGATWSADQLIDVVWGGRPPASALASLHSHISRLRGVLAAGEAGDVLQTVGDGYRVDLTCHDLDATTFVAVLGDARAADGRDPRRMVAHLDEALVLWRGPAFGQLAARQAIRPAAARLEQLRAAAAADRIDEVLALGGHAQVLGELRAVVADDPLAERPTGQLMLALYRSGRQADALEAYRALQQRLREDMGVDPGPALQRLHQQVLRQDADVAVAVPTPGVRTAPSDPVTRAPPRPAVVAPARGGGRSAPPRLVGRDEDIAAIADAVCEARVVTLTGPGGVGKTRLAEAVATRVGDHFPDGVVMCLLAGLRDSAGVDAAILDALGVQQPGTRAPEEALVAALGTRRLLLVVDNCEHLLETVARVVDRIRTASAHAVVLATSRERLHLPGEHVREVTPLPVPPDGADAEAVASTPAGTLLCTLAQAAEPTFALTDANAVTIARLCRHLDGIPLAIELAAARLRALAPEALAARIGNRFELLGGGSAARSGRHRTLQAMVDWSYALLTDPEARLFDRLSVFAGPFSLTSAERVGAGAPLSEAEVAGVLAELVDKSLVAVERADGQVRYRLLETLRAYGTRRLEETGSVTHVGAAHAEHHVRLAEQLGAAARGPDEHHALEQLDVKFDDMRVAHAALVEAGQLDGVMRLSAALHDYLVFRPRTEVFGWADRALDLAGAGGHPCHPAVVATAARGAMNAGDLERARQLAETALRIPATPGLTTIWALYVLTTTALYEGRLDDALALADRRLRIAEAVGSDYHRALAGVSRVLALMYRGDAAAAVDAAAEARLAAEFSGNHTARAWALYSSGEAMLDVDPARAEVLLEQAIEAARRVDRRFIEGVALVSLASLCGRTGQTRRALGLFRDTVAHWRRMGVYTQQLTTLRNLVELLVRVGADDAAAVVHGAVTVGSTPSFGAEADRLGAAWAQLERRLGTDGAAAAAGRGRWMSHAQVADHALAHLHLLLDG